MNETESDVITSCGL